MNPLRILVVRRDNIGDLLCTTPLLHGLRKKYPEAMIAVLASSYNAEILRGNPDVDDVFVFLKRHEKKNYGYFFSKLWKRWILVQEIRKYRFDHIILANGGWRYARRLHGKKIIGFRERHQPNHRQPDILVPLENEGRDEHEVVKMARLGSILHVRESVGPLHLSIDSSELAAQRTRLINSGWNPNISTLGLHISSRQPHQRWPKESFLALAKELITRKSMQIILFWSPGQNNNRMHPGDNEKATWLLEQLNHPRMLACPTKNLRELIAGISLIDRMICSDGGAMHVAAALQKPMVCFFGASNPHEWHPWHVPYQILQPTSNNVADISVDEVIEALNKL
jgi:ADP-heptose:LPS heptosyltransferase